VPATHSSKTTNQSRPAPKDAIRILVADSAPIQSQLLTSALSNRRNFRVLSAAPDASALQRSMQANPADVVLIAGNHLRDLRLLRWLHLYHPKVAPVLLVDNCDRELVVGTFRAGAKGLFLFNDAPFRSLCHCISCVARGQVWINSQQMHFLLDALSQVPALRVVNVKGKPLLTPREEQVVALVADGLSNREVAVELGLSEHTIKKYMLRIFDKLGVSTRVELVLYALSNGEHRSAEWLPGIA
jgi:DNA-binding NarL/FixJ family response regulator